MLLMKYILLQIVKHMKTHPIAENLVQPVAKILVHNIIGKKDAKKLTSASLSNDMMSRQIHDMSKTFLIK